MAKTDKEKRLDAARRREAEIRKGTDEPVSFEDWRAAQQAPANTTKEKP